MTAQFSKKLPKARPKGQFGEGISVQGQIAQIANALFLYSWHPDVTINDCQYHLKNMVRHIHKLWIDEDMKNPVPKLVPMTDEAREHIRDDKKVVLEHMLPVHVITTTLFKEFWERRPSTLADGIKVVEEILKKTCRYAYVSKREDKALMALQFRMAEGYEDPFNVEHVHERYRRCGVPIPTKNQSDDLYLLRKVRNKQIAKREEAVLQEDVK